jgi:uncharacterized protein YndB with AHSA1/START domain
MTALKNDQPGEFTSPNEVRLVRLLPGPIERIWEFLTDPEKRARWFAGGTMEPRTGGKMQLVFRHSNLAPDEVPPTEYAEVHNKGRTMDGRILRWEPPRVLSYTFGSTADSDVTFDLTPQGNQVLLVVTHRSRGEDIPDLPNFGSGWHSHLGLLIALLEGKARPPFWPTHTRLLADYSREYAGKFST